MSKTNYEALMRVASQLAKSSLMPRDENKKPLSEADIFAIIVQGDEMNLRPMQAIKMLTIIKGKVSMSADGMAALILRSPECKEFRPLKLTDTECVYRTQRVNQPEPTDVSFTWDDAKKAGLTGSHMYSKFPQAMLRARCVSKAAKLTFPDLTAGFYEEETGELSDGKGGTLLQAKLEESAAPVANAEPQDGMHRALELVVTNGKKIEKAEVHHFEKEPHVPFSGDAELSPFDQLQADMSKCTDLEQLTSLVPRIRRMSKEMQKEFKPLYDVKRGELTRSLEEHPGESQD